MSKPHNHPGGGQNLTQQHMQDSTDINKIVDKYNRTGVLQSGKASGKKPMFVRLDGMSFHEMLIKVQETQGQFAALPAKVRKRFANNPENLLRFLESKENLQEAIDLGLVDRDDVDPAKIAQMDLVKETEAAEKAEFEEWKKSKANPVPKADDEAQPSFKPNKRTR